jgi:hypothetical protein
MVKIFFLDKTIKPRKLMISIFTAASLPAGQKIYGKRIP